MRDAARRRLPERSQPASQPSTETISGALRGAGRSGCRSVNRLLPAGQALGNAPHVAQRPGRRWASSLYGWPSLGGPGLLGKGCGTNDAGIRASPAEQSSAETPGAPFPVHGGCWRRSKCRTGAATHSATGAPHGRHRHRHAGQGEKGHPAGPGETSPPALRWCPSGDTSCGLHFRRQRSSAPPWGKTQARPRLGEQVNWTSDPARPVCQSVVSSSLAPDKRRWTRGDAAGLQSVRGGGDTVLP